MTWVSMQTLYLITQECLYPQQENAPTPYANNLLIVFKNATYITWMQFWNSGVFLGGLWRTVGVWMISVWLSVLPFHHLCHPSNRPKYLNFFKSYYSETICCYKIMVASTKEKGNSLLKYSGWAYQRKPHRWIMSHSLWYSITWILGNLQVSAILMSYMVTSAQGNK